jgi:hypothetical protein
MLDLHAIRSAALRSDPFDWALVEHAIAPNDAASLLDTFPDEDFWVIEDDDGEKSYSYAARPLVTLGSEQLAPLGELPQPWRELGGDLLTAGYRDALSELIGRPLDDARMEASIWRWDADAQLGPHRDMEEKIVTQVFYLSREWDRGWGGCLRILRSQAEGDVVAELPPLSGTASVLVRSESSWHSVSPVLGAAMEPRRSVIVTWFRNGAASPVWEERDDGTVECVATGSVRERPRRQSRPAPRTPAGAVRALNGRRGGERASAADEERSGDDISETQSQRATKVAMVGTFDVANYGDLLLPLIAAHELGRRLGSSYEPTLYSYRPMSGGWWPYGVRTLARLREEISQFELLLLGGGQLIRFDRGFPDGYGPSDANVHHPLGLWLTPMLLAAAAGVPIAWNAPGVSADIPFWLDPLIAAGVAATGHLAVRDATSAELLRGRVSRAPARIVPDSGFGAARLLDRDTARRFEELMQDLDGATDGYVLVQPSEELREFSGAIRTVISAARDRGLAVLEVPFSPVHGDRVGCLGALGETLSLPQWPDPLLLTELVARAEAVVAQSYHAGVVALSAGVPLYRPKSPPGWKYEALEVDGVHMLGEGKRGEVSALSFGRAEPTEAARERAAQLESHWDEVAAVARRGKSPVPSEPTLSLMEGIANELHVHADVTARQESALLDRIGELEQGRADAVAWAERIGEELHEAAQALEVTATERATLLAQLEERERELHAARTVMDSVWRSPSWRLTKPLRLVKSLARGGAGR